MSKRGERFTSDGLSRLLAFSDAVVAIAMTLLVLPLTDLAADVRDGTTLGELLWSDNSLQFASFLISFAVIWVLWRNHHSMMEHFVRYDRVLVDLHCIWLLTIVILPFGTALLDDSDVRWANVLYIVILLVSVAMVVSMAHWGRRHPELLADDPATERWRADTTDGLGTSVTLILALIVAIVIPGIGSWPLLLLLLSGPVERLLVRWRSR